MTTFWVESDWWQWPLPSSPHTVCLVSFGSQNEVAQFPPVRYYSQCGFLAFQLHHWYALVVFSSSECGKLLSLLSPLVPHLTFGRPVPWYGTSLVVLWSLSLWVRLSSLQVLYLLCMLEGNQQSQWQEEQLLAFPIISSQASPVTLSSLISLLLFWGSPSPTLIRTSRFLLWQIYASLWHLFSAPSATLLPDKFIQIHFIV